MDANGFDRLAKTLSHAGTRRRLTRLLATLPLGMALTALLEEAPDVTAADDDHGSSHRRRRRKTRHKHDPGNDKKRNKGKGGKGRRCVPSCAGKGCGSADGCSGICACPTGQTCLSNGTCAIPCDLGSPASCPCGVCNGSVDGGYCIDGFPGSCAPCTAGSCPAGQVCSEVSGVCGSLTTQTCFFACTP